MRAHAALLPDGRRLHLQDGPIDLVIEAVGSTDGVADAYGAAIRRFATILDELCEELPLLRFPVLRSPAGRPPRGVVARRMWAAVLPYSGETFITPMAAVAGAVAEEVLAAMVAAAALTRAHVNNGGDIALHLAPGESVRIGLVDRPDRPSLFGRAELRAERAVRGVATSGWRGRSFSLGIADAVTVLAATAAQADAAATIVANAVDLPGHPGVTRVPARDIQPDSDLGDRTVTRDVARLPASDKAEALTAGLLRAEALVDAGVIAGAAIHLQGDTLATGSLRCVAAAGNAAPSVGPAGVEARP